MSWPHRCAAAASSGAFLYKLLIVSVFLATLDEAGSSSAGVDLPIGAFSGDHDRRHGRDHSRAISRSWGLQELALRDTDAEGSAAGSPLLNRGVLASSDSGGGGLFVYIT